MHDSNCEQDTIPKAPVAVECHVLRCAICTKANLGAKSFVSLEGARDENRALGRPPKSNSINQFFFFVKGRN